MHQRTPETAPARRLFFGIAVPTKPRRALQAASHALSLPIAARPVQTVNFHLTLAFLGLVAEHRLPCIVRAAQRIDGRGFELRLDHLGHWPRPRVLWAAPLQPPEELRALVHALQQQLRHCGFSPEQRPYQPHLTLARKVGRYTGDTQLDEVSWWVEQFHLYHSTPTANGVRYRVLASWPLSSQS